MATENTKEKKELTVEERLKAVYDLQTLLSEIDRIKTLRGELPLEVKDLEDDIEGLKTRIAKFKEEAEELRKSVSTKKIEIQQAQAEIAKYPAVEPILFHWLPFYPMPSLTYGIGGMHPDTAAVHRANDDRIHPIN